MKKLFLFLIFTFFILNSAFSQERPKTDAEKPKGYDKMCNYDKYRFMTQEEVDALGLTHDKTFKKYHESMVEKGDIKNSIAFCILGGLVTNKTKSSFIDLADWYISTAKSADPFHRDLKITIVGFQGDKKTLTGETGAVTVKSRSGTFIEHLKPVLNRAFNMPYVSNLDMVFEFFYNDNEIVVKVSGTNIKEELKFKDRFEKGITDPKDFCLGREKLIYKSKDGSFTVYGHPGTRPVKAKGK